MDNSNNSMGNQHNQYSDIPLLNLKIDSLEKQLAQFDISHKGLINQITELIVTVNLQSQYTAERLKVLGANQQNLTNKIWAIVAAVLISLILNAIEISRK